MRERECYCTGGDRWHCGVCMSGIVYGDDCCLVVLFSGLFVAV